MWIAKKLKTFFIKYLDKSETSDENVSLDENDKLKMRNGGQDRRDGHYGHDGQESQESQDSQDGQDGHDSHERNRRFFIIAQVKSTSLDLNTGKTGRLQRQTW